MSKIYMECGIDLEELAYCLERDKTRDEVLRFIGQILDYAWDINLTKQVKEKAEMFLAAQLKEEEE